MPDDRQYVCAECGEEIHDEPHTRPDGEDVHPECCGVCDPIGEVACT